MSAHNHPQVVLTRPARRDFRDILSYGRQRHGPEQEVRYVEAIDRALLLLGENPLLGRARDDLRPGLRGLPVEQHLIVYEVRRGVVRVLRILHQRMDAHRALNL
jgi:toxin ParE1/3/4